MGLLRSILFVLAVILVTVFGGHWLWVVTRPPEPLSLELQTPKLFMEALPPSLGTHPLFFTLAAAPYVKEHWQDLEGAYGLPSPLPEDVAVQCEATLQSPKDWRVLDRKWHFGALLLTGDPVTFRPLLDHLRQSPDWTLAQVDPTSLLFLRSPARSWTAADVEPILAIFQTHSLQEQKTVRTLIAHRLMYLEEMGLAKELLDQVLEKDPKNKQAWTEMAQLHGMQAHWGEALSAAEHALACEARFRPAQTAQAQALYELGQYDKALEITRTLYEASPADTTTLLLHAKVTHAAHAFGEEIEVLQRMIGLLQGNSQPVASWQIYLGQAYAAIGNSSLAEDQFKTALKDPNLSAAQRDFLKDALERLEVKPDLLNTRNALPQSSLLDAPGYRP